MFGSYIYAISKAHVGTLNYNFMTKIPQEQEIFSGLFDLPGEGFVAQIRNGTGARLYDRQGLQHLILERKQTGENSQALEEALSRINSLGGAYQPPKV